MDKSISISQVWLLYLYKHLDSSDKINRNTNLIPINEIAIRKTSYQLQSRRTADYLMRIYLYMIR